MSNLMVLTRFANPEDLLKHAKDFIDRRMCSLKNDVNHCVKTAPYAPYSALFIASLILIYLGLCMLAKLEGMQILHNNQKTI